MQTVHINVDESKLDVLLTIIKNLKEDMIESYSVSSNTVDAFYDERKKRLVQLSIDIQSGEEPIYDFDISTESLLGELKA